jgi:hypothetical protein
MKFLEVMAGFDGIDSERVFVVFTYSYLVYPMVDSVQVVVSLHRITTKYISRT